MRLEKFIEQIQWYDGEFILNSEGEVRDRIYKMCPLTFLLYKTNGYKLPNHKWQIAADELGLTVSEGGTIVASADWGGKYRNLFLSLT